MWSNLTPQLIPIMCCTTAEMHRHISICDDISHLQNQMQQQISFDNLFDVLKKNLRFVFQHTGLSNKSMGRLSVSATTALQTTRR